MLRQQQGIVAEDAEDAEDAETVDHKIGHKEGLVERRPEQPC